MSAVPIDWIYYSCDGRADVGLCLTSDRDRKHQFRNFPPYFDPDLMMILGPVLMIDNGIHDWRGGADPRPGSPARRIAKLDKLILADGRIYDFMATPAALYTDNAGAHLFLVAENPGPEMEGFPTLHDQSDLDRATASAATTAVLYLAKDCKNCAAARPSFPRIRSHFPRSFAFDVDQDLDLVRDQGVREIPTMILYQAGKPVSKIKYLARAMSRLDSCRSKILGAPA